MTNSRTQSWSVSHRHHCYKSLLSPTQHAVYSQGSTRSMASFKQPDNSVRRSRTRCAQVAYRSLERTLPKIVKQRQTKSSPLKRCLICLFAWMIVASLVACGLSNRLRKGPKVSKLERALRLLKRQVRAPSTKSDMGFVDKRRIMCHDSESIVVNWEPRRVSAKSPFIHWPVGNIQNVAVLVSRIRFSFLIKLQAKLRKFRNKFSTLNCSHFLISFDCGRNTDCAEPYSALDSVG